MYEGWLGSSGGQLSSPCGQRIQAHTSVCCVACWSYTCSGCISVAAQACVQLLVCCQIRSGRALSIPVCYCWVCCAFCSWKFYPPGCLGTCRADMVIISVVVLYGLVWWCLLLIPDDQQAMLCLACLMLGWYPLLQMLAATCVMCCAYLIASAVARGAAYFTADVCAVYSHLCCGMLRAVTTRAQLVADLSARVTYALPEFHNHKTSMIALLFVEVCLACYSPLVGMYCYESFERTACMHYLMCGCVGSTEPWLYPSTHMHTLASCCPQQCSALHGAQVELQSRKFPLADSKATVLACKLAKQHKTHSSTVTQIISLPVPVPAAGRSGTAAACRPPRPGTPAVCC